MPEQLRLLIEGLALRPPRRSVAVIHRQAATALGCPIPGYSTVHEIVRNLDPPLVALGLEGTKRYLEVYELVHRREASKPHQIWQADHTELDIWVLDPKGRPARSWLTAIEDDHSRAIAGYSCTVASKARAPHNEPTAWSHHERDFAAWLPSFLRCVWAESRDDAICRGPGKYDLPA
jgi:putative transposase